jgi:hypothetical protein
LRARIGDDAKGGITRFIMLGTLNLAVGRDNGALFLGQAVLRRACIPPACSRATTSTARYRARPINCYTRNAPLNRASLHENVQSTFQAMDVAVHIGRGAALSVPLRMSDKGFVNIGNRSTRGRKSIRKWRPRRPEYAAMQRYPLPGLCRVCCTTQVRNLLKSHGGGASSGWEEGTNRPRRHRAPPGKKLRHKDFSVEWNSKRDMARFVRTSHAGQRQPPGAAL